MDKGKIKKNTSSNSTNSLSRSNSLSKSSISISKSNASLSTSNKSASQSMDSDKSSEVNRSSSKIAGHKKTTSNTSLSTSNKSNLQSTDSANNSDISHKAEANKSSSKIAASKKATRVVQSRYKAAAVAVKKDNSSGMLDSTLSTTVIVPKVQKPQSNRSGTSKDSNGDNGLRKPISIKRSASIKKQLHSTALNATHLNASTLERTVMSDPCKFSTTVVSGKGGIISPIPKPEVFPELPDLSNISIIAKPSKAAQEELKEQPAAVTAAVTPDQLEQAHLHALLWQLLDVESDHAAHMQEKEAKNQLLYLDQLVKEKEKEVHASNEKLGLLSEAERAHTAYKTQMEGLQSLSGYMPAIGEATENLSRGLEKTLHQINTKDIYTPQDDLQYGDNFEKALEENLNLLEDLENKMHPRQESIFSFQAHVNETQMVSNMMQECSIKIQQSESLTVQEASLKLGGIQR